MTSPIYYLQLGIHIKQDPLLLKATLQPTQAHLINNPKPAVVWRYWWSMQYYILHVYRIPINHTLSRFGKKEIKPIYLHLNILEGAKKKTKTSICTCCSFRDTQKKWCEHKKDEMVAEKKASGQNYSSLTLLPVHCHSQLTHKKKFLAKLITMIIFLYLLCLQYNCKK